MRVPGEVVWSSWVVLSLLLCHGCFRITLAQDNDGGGDAAPKPPKEAQKCNGVFISYHFLGKEREYPFIKNVTAQSWAFKAVAAVLNTGTTELKSWRLFIRFQHKELLVNVDGGTVVDADSFPFKVGKNGTVLAGQSQADLKTAIDTANDFTQMQAQVKIKGTLFGGGPKDTPMPKIIRLDNEGYKCPTVMRTGGYMYSCCIQDPKYKKKNKTKFVPRRHGNLVMTYDIMQAYASKYLAQVTIDNVHPLGHLDKWNMTWEWMRDEFIYSMRGAYTYRQEVSECLYGPQGKFYADFDFSTVTNCQRKPVITDLPPERANDEKIGKLPFCCKGGILLPKIMNETKSKAVFQMEVFKLPPDDNRTAFTPPQNWKIEARVGPVYKCGPPARVSPSEHPEPAGLDATISAIATWQVSCNITAPKPKRAKCCVSYSAYNTLAAVPCNTCACGCSEEAKCNRNAPPLAIPPAALLVPFANRRAQALALAKILHEPIPRIRPCPDNCGVSINWHIDSDYRSGWTARVTIFNWEKEGFQNWTMAFHMKKSFPGFGQAYSFNATELPGAVNTIFMQGLPGQEFLVGLTNGSDPARDPKVPGKQQTVIQFSKKDLKHVDVLGGDGFPSKVYFNGGECALPKASVREFPVRSSANRSPVSLLQVLLVIILTLLLLRDRRN